jgi:hypothetical protein
VKRPNPSEHSIQVTVIDYIAKCKTHPDVFAIASANAGKRSLRLGARMKAEGMTAGVADIQILLPKGRSAWIELKAAKGSQSIPQKGFQARCERLGHPYAVCKSVLAAIEILKLWGITR